MGDSSYSFSLTTFSPSGKLVQIEYALNAVNQGKTSLGIKASNGVVIATERKPRSVLVDSATEEKIGALSKNVGCTYSGIGGDFRQLLRKGRKSAEKYHLVYKDPPPVSHVVREVASVMQEYTQSGGVRPFGVSMLVAGYDDEGPSLYQVDPSGSYWAWKASAIGENSANAKTFLEKRFKEDMELEDAIHTAILTLKEGVQGAVDEKNISIATVDSKREFKILTEEEIKDYLDEIE